MSLLEKINRLNCNLDKYKDDKKIEQQSKQLQPIYEELSSNYKELNDLVSKLSVFNNNDVKLDFEGVNDKVESLNDIMVTMVILNVLDLNQGKIYKQYKKSISEVLEKLKPAVDNAWRNLKRDLDSEVPPTAYSMLGDNARLLNIIKGKKDKLFTTLKKMPNDSKELSNVIKTARIISSEIDSFISELTTDAPSFMNDFFIEVNKGFELSRLTPEMLEWLKENQHTSGLVISRSY